MRQILDLSWSWFVGVNTCYKDPPVTLIQLVLPVCEIRAHFSNTGNIYLVINLIQTQFKNIFSFPTDFLTKFIHTYIFTRCSLAGWSPVYISFQPTTLLHFKFYPEFSSSIFFVRHWTRFPRFNSPQRCSFSSITHLRLHVKNNREREENLDNTLTQFSCWQEGRGGGRGMMICFHLNNVARRIAGMRIRHCRRWWRVNGETR